MFRKRTQQLVLPGVTATGRRRARRRPEQARLAPVVAGRPCETHESIIGDPVSRRGFLSRTLGWATASMGAAIGIPALTAITSPAFREGIDEWSPVVRIDEPGPDDPDVRVEGVPHLTSFRTMKADAYIGASPKDVPVFVLNRGGTFTIYDVRCTHLGCPVAWEEDSGRFFSPCHNGIFDLAGRVVGGPPPRPLDRYESKVEDGVLYAGRLFEVSPEDAT